MSFGSKAEHAPAVPILSETPYLDLLNLEADVAEEHMGETPRLSSADQAQIDLASIRVSSVGEGSMPGESLLHHRDSP